MHLKQLRAKQIRRMLHPIDKDGTCLRRYHVEDLGRFASTFKQ